MQGQPTEEWRPVPGFAGWYSVSSLGRIRRDARGKSTHPGKILKPNNPEKGSGYPMVTLWRNATPVQTTVHALVATAFLGPRPSSYQVNHIDGSKPNNRIQNLEYVTVAQNHAHAAAHGLKAVGEQINMAKLTEAQVREIRAATGTHRALAPLYGVDETNISLIRRRKTWKHLD